MRHCPTASAAGDLVGSLLALIRQIGHLRRSQVEIVANTGGRSLKRQYFDGGKTEVPDIEVSQHGGGWTPW